MQAKMRTCVSEAQMLHCTGQESHGYLNMATLWSFFQGGFIDIFLHYYKANLKKMVLNFLPMLVHHVGCNQF